MNVVKLTGVILNDINLRERHDGVPTGSAYLRFNEKEDEILLLCIDKKVRELTPFRKGNLVHVVGRLVLHHNHRAAILVDRIQGSQLSETDAREKARDNATFRKSGQFRTAR